MTTIKITEKPINELLAEVLHRLKHLETGQKEIKSHLWREEKQPKIAQPNEAREIIRKEALAYIHGVVLPDIKAAEAEHKDDIGAQGLWDFLIAQLAQPIYEKIKAQALEYLQDTLSELKRQAIPYAVKVADWLIEKLEDIIVNKYNEATGEQQEQFKKAISEHFPNSRLLSKLN